MLPVAQTDPASLALWLDLSVAAHNLDGSSVSAAVHAAINGSPQEAAAACRARHDDEQYCRAANLVGAIWHEQRHFLDLLLTNHGGYVRRMYATVYLNTDIILGDTPDARLAVPVTLYGDPVKARQLDIADRSHGLASLAANLRDRLRMAATDERPAPDGHHTLGSSALLEALGFTYQIASLQTYFDASDMPSILDKTTAEQGSVERYSWVLDVAHELGAVEISGSGRQKFNTPVLGALLLAGLLVRRHGQKQAIDERTDSGYCGPRFAVLYHEFLKIRGAGALDAIDAWRLLNSLSERRFNTSLDDELRNDLRLEGESLHTFSSRPREGLEFAKALHDSRIGLVEDFLTDPARYIHPDRYSREVLPVLRPLAIFVHPSGALVPPDRATGHFRARIMLGDKPLDVVWAQLAQPMAEGATLPGLPSTVTWQDAALRLAPTAKFLLFGHRYRSMLGCESLIVEQALTDTGVTPMVAPYYAQPSGHAEADRQRGDQILFLRGGDTAVCDLCGTDVTSGPAFGVTQWFFRCSPARTAVAIQALGGSRDAATIFTTDWSAWVLCDGCYLPLSQH